MGKFGFEVVDEITEESQKTRPKFNYFKLKENTQPKTIRFITEPKENESILAYSEHYVEFKNGWSRAFSCPDYGNTGTPTCVICAVKTGSNGDVVRNNTKNKFIMQVIERDAKDYNPETKETPEEGVDTVKVFSFTPFLWTTLSAFRKEYGTLGDRDYNISLVKTTDENRKTKISYIVEPLEPTKLSKADKLLIADIPSLLEVEPTYDAADFQRIVEMKPLKGNDSEAQPEEDVQDFLKQVLSSKKVSKADDEDENESLLASLKRVSPQTTKTETVEDDDEDENIDFSKLIRSKSVK